MNKVNLSGRPTRDPEIRYSQGDKSTAIASFSLAVNRKYKKDSEQSADFVNCKAFGRIAELIEKCVHKGSLIGVSGRIQTGNYTNKDGVKVYTTDVIVEELDFYDSKNSNSDNSAPRNNNGSDFMNIPQDIEDGELPFC